MSMVVSALVAAMGIVAAHETTVSQEAWLKSFEGAWVAEGAVGAEKDIVLNVARQGTNLVLRVVVRDREIVTRYDLGGADVINQGLGRKAIFRTRIDGKKLVTEIWENEAAGPPARIETRFMEAPDRMVTELAQTPGGQPFNRRVLTRKGR